MSARDAGASGDRPLLSFDLDGVLAAPPLGRNLTMNRRLDMSPPEREIAQRRLSAWDRVLMATYYRVRYSGRGPMPGALDAVATAAERHRVILISGRDRRGRLATEAWLDRHGFLSLFEDVLLNDSGLPPADFKYLTARRLGVRRHVEDDAGTAALLARAGIAVDLIDWPRNRGLTLPPGVTRRADLAALQQAIAAKAEA